ncbi:hypothetical protein ATI61_106651 [Archangium gephyra]|uniref:Uncharacterized protein n=1 Tax=Archangium gephyra TaxID=48 RepID=A0AAC8TAY5_9BACT|nr:hypothetical protein [Archangium gephyra]AKI99276.1 Hypothetical protein AA314_00903 [Archangium gephyra]REG31181.1 hypothetical protein ATI61_106651 [Archangium gephyra]
MQSVRMQLIPTASLTDATRSELWDFTSRFVETDRQDWGRKLGAHAEVILFRERGSGGLVGMAAVDFQEVSHEGRRVHIILTSSVLLDERYRGQNLLQRAGLVCFLRTRLRHPLAPIYWFFVTFSYKSYLLLAFNFAEFWPRPDQAMPHWEQGLMDTLARQWYGDAWDSTQGVVHHQAGKKLRAGVASISEPDLTQPHIRFFNARNPLYHEGELLVCMAPLTWRNWRSILGNGLRRLMRRRPARAPQLASVTPLRVPAAKTSDTLALEESGARSKLAQHG